MLTHLPVKFRAVFLSTVFVLVAFGLFIFSPFRFSTDYVTPLGIGFAIAQEQNNYPDHVYISRWLSHIDSSVGKDSPGDLGVVVGKFVTQVSRARKAYHDGTFTDIERLCQSVLRNHESNEIGFGLLMHTRNDPGHVGDVVVYYSGREKPLRQYCISDLENDEWIEIANPTDETISLRDWKLVDNSGIQIAIESNAYILPNRSIRILRVGSEISSVGLTNSLFVKRQIGDGLDNSGDRIELMDATGRLIDAVSFGNDKTYQTESVMRSDGVERRQF